MYSKSAKTSLLHITVLNNILSRWVFDAWRAAPRASDASAAARALHSLENTITLAVDAMGVSNPRTQELQGSSLPPPWHLASSPQCNNSVSPADSSAQPDLPTSERLASVTAAPDTAPAPPSQSTFSSESALVSHAATSALEVPAELEAYGSPTGASPALPSAEPTAAPSRKPHITGSLVLQLCRPLYSHIHHADGGNDAAVGPDEGGEGCVPAADLRRVLEQYLPLHLSMERVAEGGARLMEEEHPRMTLCQYVPLAWRSAPGDPVYDVGGGGGINALAAGWDVFGRPSGSHARAVHPAGWTAALGRQLHMQRSEVCL